MSIISKIKTSVEDATGLQLHYYDEAMVNQIIDNNPLPCAFFYLLKDTEVLTDSAQNTERANVAIFFVNKTEFDFNSFENEEIISACKQNADGWLRSLMASGQLKITDGTTIRSTRIYNEFDCILTGIAYNITLEEVYGFNACKDMPYVPPRIITITDNGEYDIEAFTKAVVDVPKGWVASEQNGAFCLDNVNFVNNYIII